MAQVFNRILEVINDIVHLPVVDDIIWTIYWAAMNAMAPVNVAVLVFLYIYDFFTGRLNTWTYVEPDDSKPIIITGCDTGFGNSLALDLAKRGFKIYAGCLSQKGIDDIKAEGLKNLIPIKLDVTKQADIDAVAKKISDENNGRLFGLVNNAGIGSGGLVDWMPLEQYRFILEVNFFSMVAMTKAFIPLLKKTENSRIVNVTSLAGLVPGAPMMSAYAASKHAAEAFSNSLRIELEGWGIKVVTVNPAFHKTLIAHNSSPSIIKSYESLDPAKREAYGKDYLDKCVRLSDKFSKGCWSPENVTIQLRKATILEKPRSQYLVGMDAKFTMQLLLMVPVRFGDILLKTTAMTEDMTPAAMKSADKKNL